MPPAGVSVVLAVSIVCVGRAKASAERDLTLRYLERARLAGRALGLSVDIRELPESRARRVPDRKREEAEALRAALADPGATLVAFDESGTPIDSPAFAAIFRRSLDEGTRSLALCIGGPDGLDPALRDAAAHTIAFGAMTWPHQMARIMVAEQIYRATTILSGHPYHRA